jgi:hypothetical protein
MFQTAGRWRVEFISEHPVVECGDFLQVLLDRFDIALYHVIRLQVQGPCERLTQSQALKNLLYNTRLEVTAMVICNSCGTLKQQESVSSYPQLSKARG